jgi:hypothetical protein
LNFAAFSFLLGLAAYALYKALCWPNRAFFAITQKTRRLSNRHHPPQNFATPPIDAIRIAPISNSAPSQQLSSHGINSLDRRQPKPMHFTTLLRFASPHERFAQPASPPLKK